jgi:hypothetical protein
MFQLLSNDAGFLKAATVQLSTVKPHKDFPFETCLFVRGGNEVLEAYDSLSEAVAGHAKYETMYGLKRK